MSFLSDIRHDRTKAHVVPLAVFMVLLAPFQLTGWPVWRASRRPLVAALP